MSADRRIRNEQGQLVFPDREARPGRPYAQQYQGAYHNPPAAARLRELVQAHNAALTAGQPAEPGDSDAGL